MLTTLLLLVALVLFATSAILATFASPWGLPCLAEPCGAFPPFATLLGVASALNLLLCVCVLVGRVCCQPSLREALLRAVLQLWSAVQIVWLGLALLDLALLSSETHCELRALVVAGALTLAHVALLTLLVVVACDHGGLASDFQRFTEDQALLDDSRTCTPFCFAASVTLCAGLTFTGSGIYCLAQRSYGAGAILLGLGLGLSLSTLCLIQRELEDDA